MKVSLIAVLTSLFLLSGCASVNLMTRFDATGQMGSQGAGTAQATPTQAADVKVFYGNSPEGFTLKDNELEVLDGYTHQILGPVKVKIESLSYGYAGAGCGKLEASKQTVLDKLTTRAAQEGANAIIYVFSKLPSKNDYTDKYNACSAMYQLTKEDPEGIVGSGWAVIMTPDEEKAEGEPKEEPKEEPAEELAAAPQE